MSRIVVPDSAQLIDHLPSLAAGGWVEPGGGLVQEEQFRVSENAQGEVQPPALTTREGGDPAATLLGQVHQIDHLVRRSGVAVVGRVHGERFVDGERRLDPARLEDDPDPVAELTPAGNRFRPEHRHRPLIGRSETLEDLDRRGLTCSVRPEHRHHLAQQPPPGRSRPRRRPRHRTLTSPRTSTTAAGRGFRGRCGRCSTSTHH